MKHNRGGFLVAVLLLVIAVAVAGIVYYVLRITQTGPATATGGVEPTEPSSSAAPTGAPETDAPTETDSYFHKIIHISSLPFFLKGIFLHSKKSPCYRSLLYMISN